MRFDHTNGKRPRYVIGVHYSMTDDHIYHHYYKNAVAEFEYLKAQERNAVISLYDMVKDERKLYFDGRKGQT